MSYWVQVRIGLAIIALFAMGEMLKDVWVSVPAHVAPSWFYWSLFAGLGITIVGLAKGVPWSRWLGLGTACAILPVACWAAFDQAIFPFEEFGDLRVLGVSVLLGSSLVGKSMFNAFEGSAKRLRWAGRQRALVRWCIVGNVASALWLYTMFVYWHYSMFDGAKLGTFLLTIGAGTVMLARLKTAGALLVATGNAAMVANVAVMGFHFSETLCLAVLFGPGVVTSSLMLATLGEPIVQQLRAGSRVLSD